MQQDLVGEQFGLMQFRPRFHETPLSLGKPASKDVHRIDCDDGYFVLIVGMEMRHVMRSSRFGEHTDDDAEKPAEFGHRIILSVPVTGTRRVS